MISFGFAEPPTKEEKIKPPSIAVGEYIALIQNYEVGNLDRGMSQRSLKQAVIDR